MTAPTGQWADNDVEVRVLNEASGAFMAAARRTTSLFDLDDQMLALLCLLDNADDSIDTTAELAAIDDVEDAIGHKVEGYVSVIRTLEVMAAARKAEADRLKARAASAENHAARLKERLMAHMKVMGETRIETARFTLAIQKNPPAVQILEPSMVPHEYERTTVTTTVDKRAILADFKTTGEIPAGVEITRGESLRVS